MNIEQLLAKSEELYKLKDDSEMLFTELQKVSPEILDEWEQEWEPKAHFWPVRTLRFLILKKLQRSEEVNQKVIDELKSAIEKREIVSLHPFYEAFLNSLKNYKQSSVGMFLQWPNPFSILYQFFYTNKEKEGTIKVLNKLGNEIITKYSLTDVKVHTVGFDGAQNYGNSEAWAVVIPKEASGPRDAYQIFFEVKNGKLTGGLVKGHSLKDDDFSQKVNVYNNWSELIDDIASFLPKWKDLNSQLDFTFSKDESALKQVLNKIAPEDRDFYFSLMDTLIKEMGITDEKNIIFSTSRSKLSFQIGKRYCINLKKDGFSFITPNNYVVKNLEKDHLTHSHEAFLYHGATQEDVLEHSVAIATAIQDEIKRKANVFKEKPYDNAALRQAIFDKEYRNSLFSFNEVAIFLNTQTKREMPDVNSPNLILFGPPGTGKTYNSIPYALNIINGFELKDSYTTKEWGALKKQFDDLREEGRIDFVTFHQSMSYEDFVEGIKPKMDQTSTEKIENLERLQYEIRDGVFKSIADRAAANEKISQQRDDYMLPGDVLSEIDLVNFGKIRFENWVPGNEVYEYCMANNLICIPYEIDYDFSDTASEKQTEKILTTNNLGWHEKVGVKTIKHWLKDNDIVFVTSAGENAIKAVAQIVGDYFYNSESTISFSHFRKVKWLMKDINIPVESIYSTQFSSYGASLLYSDRVKKDFFKNQDKRESQKYVLIIDEINRGNIAAIFGELITLLEPSKRIGKSEHLKVKLPYSKTDFEVPANLHIIGTMNTADRSVEALDTALRRRFSFREMTPQPELIKNEGSLKSTDGKIGDIDVVKLLETINNRLEKLIDKDHRIGHSYFMHIKSEPELKQAFKDKVIPLLEEYFFGDFGKIGLVLGSSFVQKSNDSKVFAKFDEYGISTQDLTERPVFKIRQGDDWDFISIYQEII